MTPRIITFEGSDYSGKTTMVAYFARRFAGRKNTSFNAGPLYPNALSAKLLALANQSTEYERELIYTMAFVSDTLESATKRQDDRVIFQDRYWSSVMAYGRFLNGPNSIHNHLDFRHLLLKPFATIVLSFSVGEKIKRSAARTRKSPLDNLLLSNPSEFARLEEEIDKSILGLPNIHRIDTTDKSIEQAADEVESLKLHE